MQYLTKSQIEDLTNSNSIIKETYEAFKKEHPLRNIIDMWSSISFSGIRPDYGYIKYEMNHQVRVFCLEIE